MEQLTNEFFYDFLYIFLMIFFPTYIIYLLINRKNKRNRLNRNNKREEKFDKQDVYEENFKRMTNLLIEDARIHEKPLNFQLRKDGDLFKIESPKKMILQMSEIAFSDQYIKRNDFEKIALSDGDVKYCSLMLCLKVSSLTPESRQSIRLNSYVSTTKKTPYSKAIIQRLFFLIAISLFYTLKAENYPRISKNVGFHDKLLERSFNNINNL